MTQHTQHHQLVIIGGGTGGLSVAAQLANLPDPPQMALIEPSERHYYQPLWTLVGAGVFPREVTERPEADYVPRGVTWIQDAARAIDPDRRTVTLASGQRVTYDLLVVATGLTMQWDAVEGLSGQVGHDGVCSNYAYDTVASTWDNIRTLRRGRAIFTMPDTPIKCGGAPQKIMYLAEDFWRRGGVRDDIEIVFATAKGNLFAVEKYRRTLERIVAERGIQTRFFHDLVGVEPHRRIAHFKNLQTGEVVAEPFDMLHVTPPQGPLELLAGSPVSNAAGWVEVDKHTLQHVRYPEVFALGDCSSLPTSKTGAAIRKQAPVLVANLRAFMAGRAPTARYDGYTSCPLVTGYGKLVLAEFDYDGNPAESFPFDQSQERYSMYALKAYGLPRMYWHGMLRGRM